MFGKGRGRRSPDGRRSGPTGEERWWSVADQRAIETDLAVRTDFGRGWIPTPMWNNAERLDPYGDDPASELLRAARSQRTLTALDEGQAWRRRRDGALAVLRTEVFAEADDEAHRAAWRQHGPAALDATWRARWAERDRAPGWIEARWRAEVDRHQPLGPVGGLVDAEVAPHVDWVSVEDQTSVADADSVTSYEHLTLWTGRAVATLIVRHHQHEPGDEATARAGAAIYRRLAAALAN